MIPRPPATFSFVLAGVENLDLTALIGEWGYTDGLDIGIGIRGNLQESSI